MLYEVYQKRIQKIAAFLSVLLKLMPLIISIVSVIILTTVVILSCTGLPSQVNCMSEVIYGDAYTCEAKAFRSDVRVEFCAEGSEEWTEEKPHMPGKYLTRAVGTSVFEKDRFGKATEFSILPRPVDVRVKDSSVIYGEIPDVISQTVYSDTFFCDNVIFERTTQVNTKVKADIAAVQFFDSNGNDITYAYSVNIVESNITFEKRSITVTVESASKEYDNTPLSLDAYALTKGTLAFSDSLGAVFNTSITDVGTVYNVPVFQILQNDSGTAVDVTELYDITTVKGTLTVTTRVLKINTGSFEAIYSGEKISCEEFEVDSETAPIEGHTVSLATAEGYTEVGTHKNKVVIRVTDKDGVDKTSNYAVYYLEGSITITPKPLLITTHDNEWVYDGLSHPNYEVTAEGLIEGHKANHIVATQETITDVGSAENVLSVSITDSNDKIVSGNYEISYKYGTLTVKPRPITFKTSDAEWIYDGKEHCSSGYETVSELHLISGHTFDPLEITAITDAGKKTNVFSSYRILDEFGNDKTFCYTITFQNGTLEVKKRPITVKPEDTEKIYDGTALYGGEIKLHTSSEYQLVEGHTMTAKPSGSRTDVGTASSGLSSIVIKEGDRDVTKNYSVETVKGAITIHKRPIIILTGSAEKNYDGKPLTSSKFSVPTHSEYQLVVGHRITMKMTGSQTKIGESPNTYNESGTKITAQNKDVTKNYEISYELGTLKVNPYAVISILTNSDIKIYDGKPLTNDGYETVIVRGKIQSGHKLRVDVFGSQTEPGTAPNEATAKVLDSKGKDVTSSYELSISPGTLEVKEAKHDDNNAVFGQIKTDKGGTVYLYMRSYGNYNGQTWSGGIDYGKTLPGGYSYNYLTSIAIRNQGKEAALAEIKDCSLFMLPYYLGFGGNYDIQRSDVAYVSKDSNYTMEYYFPISGLNGYEEWKGNLGDYAQYEKEYRKFVYKNYLTVDAETAKYMNTLIAQNKFTLEDPNVIQKIASYIQNAATYSLDYDPYLDVEKNVVIAFLDQYKEGKCVHYASAATLLYRTLGIPARYVTGWMIETVKDQFVDISNPGHAWVEVYIDDLGWVQVEVTGSDPNADSEGGGGNGGKPTITLTPKYTFGVYDGRTLYAMNKIEPDATLAELLRKGYTYKATMSGSRTEVGRSTSTIQSFTLFDPKGNDVTDQFNYSQLEGVIDIFEKSTKIIKVYLFELQKVYDGNPITFNNDDYAIIDIESGAKLDLSLNISLTNAGFLTLSDINKDIGSYATYTVQKDGVDITSKCALIFDTFEHTPNYYVPLRVDHRGIGISSATEVKVADGKPLFNTNVFISHGSLVPGDKMEAYAIGFIDYVGTVENEIYSHIVIVNSKGEDVTDNYYIDNDTIGTLTIVDEDE